ncbi:hypothetical protein ASE08_17955 [Rhizobacter sp. Root16D2]|nr:hypothetical protein ASC98_13970 [Rhizobacter sp. Root1238]KRB24395.1 hypothetical protein ASE08_17955 [Rhizobacter sp. Root16D2]
MADHGSCARHEPIEHAEPEADSHERPLMADSASFASDGFRVGYESLTKRCEATRADVAMHIEMISLKTNQLILRTPSLQDLSDYLAFRNETAPNEGEPQTASVRESDARTLLSAQQDRSLTEPGWLMMVLEHPQTGRVIGEVGGFRSPHEMSRANIGWWLHHAYRGQGLATEAVAAFIQWGFENLGLELVDASCHADNHRSQALMERLGMHREPDTKRELNGRSFDERTYSLHRLDWLTRPKSG